MKIKILNHPAFMRIINSDREFNIQPNIDEFNVGTKRRIFKFGEFIPLTENKSFIYHQNINQENF